MRCLDPSSERVHVLTLCLHTSAECKIQLAIPTLHGHLNCDYTSTFDAPEPHPSRNLVAIITFASSEPLLILLLPPASCSDCSQYKSSHSLQIVSAVEMQGSCSNSFGPQIVHRSHTVSLPMTLKKNKSMRSVSPSHYCCVNHVIAGLAGLPTRLSCMNSYLLNTST